MSRRYAFLGLLLAIGASAGLSTAEAQPAAGGESSQPGLVVPRVRPQPIPLVTAPRAFPQALPRGAHATFPGFVGDAVFVSLKPAAANAVTTQAVYSTAIAPVLRALRFKPGPSVIAVPKGNSQPRPRANLARLATEVCREFQARQFERRPVVREICDVMRGIKRVTPQIDRIFRDGEGMTFAQFKADIQRSQIQYVFRQVVGRVPIEHSGLIATRWEGETVTSVYGTVFTRFALANKPGPADRAISLGVKNMLRVKGIIRVQHPRAAGELVLLPYGGITRAGATLPALRYAYRLLVLGTVVGGRPGSWIAYFDASDGKVLELVPQFADLTAFGRSWRRAPDTPTVTSVFQVDPASGGQYTLEFNDAAAGVFNRFDRLGNGVFSDGEVSISASSSGSSASLANFDQSPLNDAANAICAAGGNNTFRQVNAYAHLSSLHDEIVYAGSFPQFPEFPITVWVDTSTAGGNNAGYDAGGAGRSRLDYVIGTGFAAADCPNAVGQSLSGTQDPTSMAHEFAHLSTPRLQERRPSDWCGAAPCQMPTGRLLFHDFADAVAHAHASINCQAGWSRKNVSAVNGSLNCVGNTSEGGGLPRLAQVNVPFSAASPGDHFPEHRLLATGDYADGQIAAAALWALRQGMRSKCLPSGTPQYFVRLMRALWNFGFLPSSCTSCDRDIYRYLQDLLRQLTNQWATSGQPGGPPGFAHNGSHTTNKVTAGFARAGLFLVPYQCIDGDTATADASFCPGGENGGDAIVDVDDNNTSDDIVVDGVTIPDFDYLNRSGSPPSFHVWTGPRYKFTAAGTATGFTPSTATPSPCYTQYQVEVATTPSFSGTVVTSTPAGGAWRTVSTSTAPECYARWTMSASDWASVRGTSGETRIYYRVRTRDAAGTTATERVSTAPGNGLFTVPAAYAIVQP